jgi:sterol desaturase/sphingolipid hydroxylase (fatty acid hydroxylase superfamily)
MAKGMSNLILEQESIVRFAFFFGILMVMAVWEVLAPRRVLTVSKKVRWFTNLGLVFIDTLALRWLLPVTAVTLALLIEKRAWGVLTHLELPFWIAVVIGVVALDFVIYLQHAMFHYIPAFWRLHRVHHTDLDFDVTTGVRFHPLEIFLSMGIKMAAITLLGTSALAVIIFEILLNTTSMFNHGNIRLPFALDQRLRLFVVTPEMHRVHHSVVIKEYNSNFGFNLPWWDRILGTYRDQPAAGHEGMILGLAPFRDPERLTLARLLAHPFIGNSPTSPSNTKRESPQEMRNKPS